LRRSPIDFGDYYAGKPPDARFAPVLTYPEWLREQERTERRARRLRALGTIVLVLASVATLAGALFMACLSR
jgi:hypothetical protein